MKRRQIIRGVVAAVSASLAVGSGALNTARADRDISVEVVNDVEAYLRINPLRTESSEGEILGRSDQPGKVTRFQFPGTYEELDNLVIGDGPGINSDYYFDRLVEIGNQGTNEVEISSTHKGKLPLVSLYNSDDPDRRLLNEKDYSVQLDTGERFDAGIYIDTRGIESGVTVEDTLSVVGEAANS